LYWTGKLSDKPCSVNEVLGHLEKIQNVLNTDAVKVGKGVADLFVRDEKTQEILNKFSIEFKSVDELKERIAQRTDEGTLVLLDVTLLLNILANVYDEQGNITKQWIEEPLQLSVSNEEQLTLILYSYCDVLLPDLYYHQESEDNVELAKLNLPILDGLLSSLIQELGIEFKVHVDLSEKNVSMLNIENRSIKFKDE